MAITIGSGAKWNPNIRKAPTGTGYVVADVDNTAQTRQAPASPGLPLPTWFAGSGSSDSSGGSSGYSGSGSSGSSSGSSAPTKAADAEQVRVLRGLLDSGFKQALDQRIANIKTLNQQGDSELLKGYNERLGSLKKLNEDNEKAEATGTFANLSNRARESADLLTEAYSQGVGETDALRTQLMSARNWLANQNDVNRSYFDSAGSNASARRELAADTRSARMNLATQGLGDQEQAWSTYANQMAETATQLGNIQSNPNSDSYDANSVSSWGRMAENARSVWKNPGVSADISGWQGEALEDPVSNMSVLPNAAGKTRNPRKRPEGSTLQKW